MDIRKLQRAIVDGLEDVKAQDIVVFDTEHLSPLFERVIVASGQSNRQTKALASSVRETVKSRGFQVLRMEGEGNGEWIIVDCGAAVVHVMQPAIREYYHLEEIWGDKPVRLKLGAPAPRPARATESTPAAAEKKVRAKPATAAAPAKPARKAAGSTSAGKSVAPSTPKAAPTGKTTRSGGVVGGAKAPAKKAAAPRKAAPRSTAGSAAEPVARKAAPRPAAKSAPAAAPKPAARKPAGKAAAKTAAPTRLSGTVGKPPAARKAASKGSAPVAAKKAPARKTSR